MVYKTDTGNHKMKVFVCGLESSGQRWVRSIFAQHPMVESTGDSFPCHMGSDRKYPHVDFDVRWVVIVVRDRTCQIKSVDDKGHNNGQEGKFTEEQNMKELLDLFDYKPVILFSYEVALMFKQKYFNHIFEQMNLPRYQIKTEFIDGNEKYLKSL